MGSYRKTIDLTILNRDKKILGWVESPFLYVHFLISYFQNMNIPEIFTDSTVLETPHSDTFSTFRPLLTLSDLFYMFKTLLHVQSNGSTTINLRKKECLRVLSFQESPVTRSGNLCVSGITERSEGHQRRSRSLKRVLNEYLSVMRGTRDSCPCGRRKIMRNIRYEYTMF